MHLEPGDRHLPLGSRPILQDALKQRVGSALLQQYGDPDDLSVAALVHDVEDHRVSLAVDGLLGRMMEVELDDLVTLVAYHEEAAGAGSVVVVHPERPPVVDHVSGRLALVFESQRRQVCLAGVVDVDRRLRLAGIADLVCRVLRAPVRRPTRTLVRPRGFPGRYVVRIVGAQRPWGHGRSGCCDEHEWYERRQTRSHLSLSFSVRCATVTAAAAGMIRSQSKYAPAAPNRGSSPHLCFGSGCAQREELYGTALPEALGRSSHYAVAAAATRRSGRSGRRIGRVGVNRCLVARS